MFTQEVTQSRSDYFDHFVPAAVSNKMTNSLVSSTFLSPTPSTYSDAGSCQQSPLNIYNNYNPNYHHHHYYFHPNYQDYGYNQQQPSNLHENNSNWLRKFDYESQKEYFIANTPPAECCDFEVPQQRVSPSLKPTTTKLFNDLDKIFFDDQISTKVHINNINYQEPFTPFSLWDGESSCSEKLIKKCAKIKEKSKSEAKNELKLSKNSKRITQEGEREINCWEYLNCWKT